MKLTVKKLEKLNACSEGIEWFKSQKEIDLKKVCIALLKDDRFSWANWILARCLTNDDDRRRYAIYAAKQVLHIFEARYPDDKRPRLAIKAAEIYLKNKTEANKKAAANAAYAAAAAADSAYAADYAGDSAYAAYAADSAYAAAAAAAADYAADSAGAAAAAAAADSAAADSAAGDYAADSAYADYAADSAYAAYAAANAAYAAADYAAGVGSSKELKTKIIKYGLRFVK